MDSDCGERGAGAGAGLWLALATFSIAIGADLVTKAAAVDWGRAHGGIYFNPHTGEFSRRVVMCACAVAVTCVLARMARWRGLGTIWGSWIGLGLLVAGVIGNGLSPFVWSLGVPDFIAMPGGWVWNLADFEISFGLLAVPMSVAATAGLAWWRETRAEAPSVAG